MNKSMYPCLWFNGQSAEAAKFYATAFPNSRITTDTSLVVHFELNGVKLMGLNGGPQCSINPSVSLFAAFNNPEEVENAWYFLSVGGKTLMPLDAYPWSEKYGWLQDKYGVSWQLYSGKKSDPDQPIAPLLMFTGQNAGKAEEAMNYYISLFENSRIGGISRYNEGEHDTTGFIKHAEFFLNGNLFMAIDSSHNHGFNFNEGFSFVVECDNQEEIDRLWNSFADGGKESMCGWVCDRYGLWWQVIPSILGKLMQQPDKAQRVMQEVMKTRKFEISKLLLIE